MKKLLLVAVFVFAFALAITPAFAFTVVKSSNWTEVNNNVNAVSNTGKNAAFGVGHIGVGVVKTGDATSVNEVTTVANSNKTKIDCGCNGFTIVKNWNGAEVNNNVNAVSNTGKNLAGGAGFVGVGVVKTGDAGSGNTVVTMVNSNVTKIGGGFSD
ncbi:MAG: hypothetical protein CO141_03175 [Candidatus Moranbacteria bacterium CG_4_9_14_3_um_filter_42_9]|nr:MAG: hypothetical protein CO141_03175 [Candidatus Moranbacteria bacterium CG_4_9_14_3_um_filter_42_9]